MIQIKVNRVRNKREAKACTLSRKVSTPSQLSKLSSCKERDGGNSAQNSGSEWHKNACCRERRRSCGLVPPWLP